MPRPDQQQLRASARAWAKLRWGPGRRMACMLLGALVLQLTACAARMPAALRQPEPAPLTPLQARTEPAQHLGSTVRWGGRILEVDNAPDATDIIVLARPLDGAAKPQTATVAAGIDAGRFIARFVGFLDPAQYSEGRALTVTGTLVAVETRDIGAYPYRYPVVHVLGWHLWPMPEPQPLLADPWGWGPWYGWGHGPWYRPGPPAGPWYHRW